MNKMKQVHLQVLENDEPHRGRKVYDQKIYVSALERGTRDRSPRPRRVEPLPDRIELKICPQKNHRGRMKYYRSRSIPELCRITLTPTGESALQDGQIQMEEVYITQYTHSFDHQIDKPHIVAWKRAFEDGDIPHCNSKLCIVNSPVGSKAGGFSERRGSAPPGSFVFNYDQLDMPQALHRRSKSLGTFVDDEIDFEKMDAVVGESAGGKLTPLVHEKITAQKVEQVKSVNSSFWEEGLSSFDAGYYYDGTGNTTNRNSVHRMMMSEDRKYDVTYDDVITHDVIPDNISTDEANPKGISRDALNTRYSADKKYDVITDDVIKTDVVMTNSRQLEYENVMEDRDTSDHSTEDPTKQARSLISTLRSTVKKPDSKTFLRSVHDIQTAETPLESTSSSRSSLKSQPEEASLQNQTDQEFLQFSGEFPQKVTLRYVSNPRKEYTFQTARQSDILAQNILSRETTSGKTVPQRVLSPQEDLPREVSPHELSFHKVPPQEMPSQKVSSQKISPQEDFPQFASSPKISHQEVLFQEFSPQDDSPQEVLPQDGLPPDVLPQEVLPTKVPSMTIPQSISGHQAVVNDPSITGHEKIESKPRNKAIPFQSEFEIHPGHTKTSHYVDSNKQTKSQPKDTNFDDYEDVPVTTSRRINLIPKSERVAPKQDEDLYQKPDSQMKRMEVSETSHSIHSKNVEGEVRNHHFKSSIKGTSKATEPGLDEDFYRQPNPVFKTMATSDPKNVHPKQVENTVYKLDAKAKSRTTHHTPNIDPTENYYQQPSSEVRTVRKLETIQFPKQASTSNVIPEVQLSNFDQEEDYYQQPNSDVEAIRRIETNQLVSPKQTENTVYKSHTKSSSNSIPELRSPFLGETEDYYPPNPDVRAEGTIETDQLQKPAFALEEDYYQQPKPEAGKIRSFESRHSKLDEITVRNTHSTYKTSEQVTTDQNEEYYQQPRFKVKEMSTAFYETPTELRSNEENVYEEPKNATTKCPLDEEEIEKNTNAYYYKQPLPANHRVSAQPKTSENYYEVPTNANLSSTKCPLDEKDGGKNYSTNHYEEPVAAIEHVYEQPNFAGRIYEEFDYEKMNAPVLKVSTSFYKEPKSGNELVYEQPNKSVSDINLYENLEVEEDKKHLRSKAEVLVQRVSKTSHHSDRTVVVNELPKSDVKALDSFQPAKLMSSEMPGTGALSKARFDAENPMQRKNIERTNVDMRYFSASSTKTQESAATMKERMPANDDGHSTALNYHKNAFPNSRSNDKKFISPSFVTRNEDFNEDFKTSAPPTRVMYSGEVYTKKVAVTSSGGIDQSGARVSDSSPKQDSSRSASSEGELLQQQPEAEVLQESQKRNHNVQKSAVEEFSQPSVYSKTNSQSNTSLARFSSFSSEASYKRKLTSAWIEQQRVNFKRPVNREPSLRRTKSVELHKEQKTADESREYKLKHTKSELSLEQLNAMYEPYDKHYAKVAHISESQVITKAKSFEDRAQKAQKTSSEVNTEANQSKSLPVSMEKDIKNRKPGNTPQNLSMEESLLWENNLFASNGVKHREQSRQKARPKTDDVSRFDIAVDNNQPTMKQSKSEHDNVIKNGELKQRGRSSNSRQEARPKSDDVSRFDITAYSEEHTLSTLKQSKSDQDKMFANDEFGQRRRSSTSRQKPRPKSDDMSRFDITAYNEEPTLKQSKSERSVDQLKAMYDPYDQNAWFSPSSHGGPASQALHQSDSRQVDQSLHEVLHRRTRSEPEKLVDRSKSGGNARESERETKAAEMGNFESKTSPNITKLDSSSVLLLNVVEFGRKKETPSPKLKRNISKSASNIVSGTASEIEDGRHLTRKELMGSVEESKMGPCTTDSAQRTGDKPSQSGKPVEKLRARYITGGERASVRYLSKSTDVLASNDNTVSREETTLAQLQGQRNENPTKASKKEGGFRNFFGKIRKSKSEPNLDKNFSVLDVEDSEDVGKKQNSQKIGETEKNLHETSPKSPQAKSQTSSKSGLKASSFYPKFKNFKKNFTKSKQNKEDGSDIDSGQDLSRSEEFPERSVFLESDIQRQPVELTESQNRGDDGHIESIVSKSANLVRSRQSYTDESEVVKDTERIEKLPDSKSMGTKATSPKSPVTSPRSTKRRFFQSGNRVTPTAVVDDGGEANVRKSNILVNLQENRVYEGERITKDSDVFVRESSPVVSTLNDNGLHDQYIKRDSREINNSTVQSIQARYQVDSKSRFAGSSSNKENLVPSTLPSTSTAYITKRATSFEDKGKADPGSNNELVYMGSNDKQGVKSSTTYRAGTSYITTESNSVGNQGRNLSLGIEEKANDPRNKRRSFHEEALVSGSDNTTHSKFKVVYQDDSYQKERNSFHEHSKMLKDHEHRGIRSNNNESRNLSERHDSRNNDLDPNEEKFSTKDDKEPEIASPKTKHRTFFGTKIFTNAGRSSSSQGGYNREEINEKESLRVSQVVKMTEDSESEKLNRDPRKTKKNTLDSNRVLRREQGDELSNASQGLEETDDKVNNKASNVLKKKDGKDTGNTGQVQKKKDDKEKQEFGTKIKGFISKVLPQRDKTSSKDELVKEEALKKKKTKQEKSLDDNNNKSTVVSITEGSNDENNFGAQKSRTSFVVKHMGESDNEKSRTSEDETNQVEPTTMGLHSFNSTINERRTSYASKVKHIGDSDTVKAGSFEKLSEKPTNFDDRNFTGLAIKANQTAQKKIEVKDPNKVGEVNAIVSYSNKEVSKSKRLQDEVITKTEMVDDVEAFDEVFDIFNTEFVDEKDNGKNVGFAKENDFKVGTKHELQPANIHRTEKGLSVPNDWKDRSHLMTAEVRVNESDSRREIGANMESQGTHDTIEYVQRMSGDEKGTSQSSEKIKGFTIKHTKTSSLVLNKSMEDSLDSVGKNDVVDPRGDEEVEDDLKRKELDQKQGNTWNMKTKTDKTTKSFQNKSERNESDPAGDGIPSDNGPKKSVFLVNHEEVNKQQQLNYVEKVMISVHRGASDVKRLVRDAKEITTVSSSDQTTFPVSTSLERGRSSSGGDIDNSSSRTKVVISSEKKELGTGGSKPQKIHQKRAVNVNEDWSNVVDEFVTRNKEENTYALDQGDDNNEDELFLDLEEQIGLRNEKTKLRPKDSSTLVEDTKTKKHRKTSGNELPTNLYRTNNIGGGSQTLIHTENKTLKTVGKAEGARFTKPMDKEDNQKHGTYTNASFPELLRPTTQSPGFNSNTFIKDVEMKSTLPTSSSATTFTNYESRSFSSNFQEQQTGYNTRTASPLKPKTEAEAGAKLKRPKSQLNKDTKNNKALVSKSQARDVKRSSEMKDGVKGKGKNYSTNEAVETKLVSKQKGKVPPAVLPKPKRNKSSNGTGNGRVAASLRGNGKETSELKPSLGKHPGYATEQVGNENQEVGYHRKQFGYMDIQNNNLSFVNFQMTLNNYQRSSAKDEPNLSHSTQNFLARQISPSENTVISSQRMQQSTSVTTKQFKKEKIEKSSSKIKQFESKEMAAQEATKQRKKKRTTASETSEDLSTRLQRLLCADDSVSEPEPDDSSVYPEASTAINSFSEDSEFDTSVIQRRYKSLERAKKSPVTMKIHRNSQISINDSSDDELFRNDAKLNHRFNSKTL